MSLPPLSHCGRPSDPIFCTKQQLSTIRFSCTQAWNFLRAFGECWRKTMGKTPLQSLTLFPWKIMGQEDDLLRSWGMASVFFGRTVFTSGGYVQHLKWKSSFSQHLGTELTLQYNQFTNLDLQSSGFLLQISIKVAKCIKKLWDCVKQTAPTSKLPSKHSQRLDPELSENEAS